MNPNVPECDTLGRCLGWPKSLALILLVWASVPPAGAQQKPDLSQMAIEDLMNIEVTSVSKKEQKLSRSASAIFVITQDDIRHSGATNIPDVLRIVPGLDVAQINGSTWAISSRGLNSQIANKLLVLIDGRTVYAPLFAGVYWDVQDVPLEDIERIEVIRGPGATVWGANAVNGVINIITKSAAKTQGGLLVSGGGSHQPVFGVVQYGGKVGQAIHYRMFVKGFDQRSFPSLSGRSAQDEFDLLHGGFRVDSKLSEKDSLTVQGDLYEGSEGESTKTLALTPPFAGTLASSTSLAGGNLLGRWTHTFSPRSDTRLQVYFDRTRRDAILLGERVNTTDIEFQHHVGWGNRQDFVWGVGFRYYSYATTGSETASISPASQGRRLFTFFLQDEITLQPDHVYFTIGTKVERNDFSGFEFQPSVRIAWNVTRKHMLWAGYSRARRTPSPADRGLSLNIAALPGPIGLPVLTRVIGGPATVSENLDAFEVGHRAQLRPNLSLDFSTFYNRYRNLNTFEPGSPFMEFNPQPPHLKVTVVFANQMHGEAHGLEVAANWKVTNRWTLSPGYAFERIHLRINPASHDTTSVVEAEGGTAHIQAQLRSVLVLPRRLEWHASAYFVGRLPAQQVPSYTRLDSGITWRASEDVLVSLVGQNLLQDRHLEVNSIDQTKLSSLIKRSVYAKLTWQF